MGKISAENWIKIDETRELKRKMDSISSKRIREKHRYAYSTKDKEVKKPFKKGKND